MPQGRVLVDGVEEMVCPVSALDDGTILRSKCGQLVEADRGEGGRCMMGPFYAASAVNW
jgi:hypothetical protein